jgi:hypothetical protein
MILFLLAAMLLIGCGQANQKQPEDRRKIPNAQLLMCE